MSENSLGNEVQTKRVGLIINKRFPWVLKMRYKFLHSNNFKKYVKLQFLRLLNVYNPDLKGVVIRFRNIKIVSPIEAALTRRIIVKCFVDFYLFKPEIGNTLTGVVLKTGSTFVCCILYDFFPVSVLKPNDEPEDTWTGQFVSTGDTITFEVLEMDIKKNVPYITSKIINVLEY